MTERRTAATLALACAAVGTMLAACVPLSPPPYATPSPVRATPVADAGNGFSHAETISLRVWATTCSSYRNGSAWMLDESHAVTNRHVVEGASVIELTDYRGTEYHGTTAAYSDEDDLAIVTIDGEFPEAATLATTEPEIGEDLTITGYALGGPLEALTGPYVALRENDLDPAGAPVYYVEVAAREGNSGSPVTNANGEVVGVVFSSDGEEFAGAVTLDRLLAFLDTDDDRIPVDGSC